MYTNHELMNYDYVEGIEFEGLMPHAIDKIGGVGVNDNQPNVHFMGVEALGHDQLEIVDAAKLFEGQGSSEPSGSDEQTTPTDEPVNP
jgi:hypothetical protein